MDEMLPDPSGSRAATDDERHERWGWVVGFAGVVALGVSDVLGDPRDELPLVLGERIDVAVIAGRKVCSLRCPVHGQFRCHVFNQAS
jgi:hypothetical protein